MPYLNGGSDLSGPLSRVESSGGQVVILTWKRQRKLMEPEELLFNRITATLAGENESVNLGKMMSSPGITYRKKVFAFYYKKEMIFKLGKEFDPASFEITDYSLLSPFKTKPPLAGWFQIPYAHHRQWERLARHALDLMAKQTK